MTRVKKEDVKKGEYYYDPLVEKMVCVYQRTTLEDMGFVVHVTVWDGQYKRFVLDHDLFELNWLEKLIYRV